MSKQSRLVISLACLLWVFGAQYATAQTPTARQAQVPWVIAATSTEAVRFTASARVYELRLEVFAANGQTLYDSDFKFGNLLDWGLHDQQGQRLADGSYSCVVTLRALHGSFTRRQGTLLLADGQPSLQAARSPQSIRPVNPLLPGDLGDFLTLPGKTAGLPLTALGHDGQQGRVMSGLGGLSFRLGDFFTGKDVEQMRPTTEGKLGIGVENPQAKLDVAGLIRTSEGIVFPDGSVQTTAYVASGRSISERAGIQRDGQGRNITEQGDKLETVRRLAPNISGSGTTGRITKWDNGPSGIVADSIITESAGKIGIGTSAPVEKLTVSGGSIRIENNYFYMSKDYTGTPINVFGIDSSNHAQFVAGIGGDLRFAPNGGDQYFQFVIKSVSGNVGVGTLTPNYKLHVVGGSGTAVYGETSGGATYAGVYGKATVSQAYGVKGETSAHNGYGVYGIANTIAPNAGYGVYGQANGNGYGVFGNLTTGSTGWAGYFNGKVTITGPLDNPGGSFKIDHPLDPANKFLSHSFVESPDMMNIYNGNVTTDYNGVAVVTLPDYFEVLNRDFRYQLTVIGAFAQAIIAEEISGNQFKIATSLPNVKVSWQVTGVRQDAWANKHRIPNEEMKSETEKGFFLHPDLYGKDEEKGLDWARNPELMRQLKQQREKAQTEKEKKSN
jgi:hypothetical protein